MKPRLALALVAGLEAAIALYAVTRVVQARFMKEPDPALVIWSEHAGFFWRGWTVAYVGGMVAFAAWMLAKKDEARVARLCARSVLVVALLIAIQGVLVP